LFDDEDDDNVDLFAVGSSSTSKSAADDASKVVVYCDVLRYRVSKVSK